MIATSKTLINLHPFKTQLKIGLNLILDNENKLTKLARQNLTDWHLMRIHKKIHSLQILEKKANKIMTKGSCDFQRVLKIYSTMSKKENQLLDEIVAAYFYMMLDDTINKINNQSQQR